MGKVLKLNPKALDAKIDYLQNKIYNYLVTNEGWTNYESYHRVYKNYKDGQVIPELYLGNNEYTETLFDDKYNATSFFLTSDIKKQIGIGIFEETISIIFQVKLDKLYPTIQHRADEECRISVLSAIIDSGFSDKILNVITGIDNVYKEFKFTNYFNERVKITDISDYHVFRIDLKLNYPQLGC